ncbi:MAG: hypothetical protein WDZ49_13715, partial [Litorilinea sp.]
MKDNLLKSRTGEIVPGGSVRRPFNRLGVAAICLLFVVFVAACGGAEDPATPAPARVIPTMPPASFAQPTTMISAGAPTETDDTETDDTETDDT